MSNRVLKDYVRLHLQQVEAADAVANTVGNFPALNENQAKIPKEPVAWCRSLERCLAYTFESYCKLVLSTAMQRAHASHSTEITHEIVEQTIDLLFPLPHTDIATSKDKRPHDFERCLRRYREYFAWYQRQGHHIYNTTGKRMSNLSLHRLQWRLRAAAANHATDAQEAVEGRYVYSAPQHTTPHIPLDQVFERYVPDSHEPGELSVEYGSTHGLLYGGPHVGFESEES
ncbi:non-ribosomal peptide synthetase, putative [Babesia ovata]|uniref:Non-ribosomal peptide synthetase, putative n=1 Tax=Babesia ovata TaxID=189622 RepID=A0A2H6K6Q2_9APIC|nr:non-ribosomal peptide synthetase, putative [Babesia ovata]GBE58659.1 non-ribosomal peptide synthetase, putative [Babesia ovata]